MTVESAAALLADGAASARPVLVVMGVSGSGKSTVGARLAERLGTRFIDADDLHPPANKEKMRRSEPLTDVDRQPWLEVVGRAAAAAAASGPAPVVACSALKRAYRDILRAEAPGAVVVHLEGDREYIRSRMAGRAHEYMPDDLLDSQFEVLEAPAADEAVIRVGLDASVDDIVARIIAALPAH